MLGSAQKLTSQLLEYSSMGAMTPAGLARAHSKGKWRLAPHLNLLNRKLMRAARGNYRLMVFMPPRHGKSELCSRYFPAWHIGVFPEKWIMLCSYESTFASTWGQRARDVLETVGHETFGVSVRADSRNRRLWETPYGGGMITAGVGGPITGRGAHMVVIDDPVKNAEEAMSPVIRERNWDWYLSTLYTRLEPNASIILLMTRWHEDDLAGKILEESKNAPDEWDILTFPAICEQEDDDLGRKPGEALWPWRYDEEALQKIRRTIRTKHGDRWWQALYQQRPSAPEGGLFKRFWFEPNTSAPRMVDVVRYWDLAATEDGTPGDPDWTVGCKIGRDEHGCIWVLDVRRLRGSPREVEDVIMQVTESDGYSVNVCIEQEPGSSGKHLVDYYRRVVLKDYMVHTDKVSMNKVRRAEPLSARAEVGELKMLNGSWNNTFLDEMVAFPFGTHDDQVDAASGAYVFLVKRDSSWDEDSLRQLSSGRKI